MLKTRLGRNVIGDGHGAFEREEGRLEGYRYSGVGSTTNGGFHGCGRLVVDLGFSILAQVRPRNLRKEAKWAWAHASEANWGSYQVPTGWDGRNGAGTAEAKAPSSSAMFFPCAG